MNEENDFNALDKEVLDIDEVEGTDIKINPDFYIHNALIKAQVSLLSDDYKLGFTKFRIFVEHIEVLCEAANMLSADYKEKLEEEKKQLEEEKDTFVKEARISNLKLKLILTEVFSKKTLTSPMKF
jgi:hypothetical protein